MLVPYRPLEKHSLEWPLTEDLIIPQFVHERYDNYLINIEMPLVSPLLMDVCHLVWIKDTSQGVYRMVRLFDDGTKHGEDTDDHGVPTGRFVQCPCDFCNAVKPIPYSK